MLKLRNLPLAVALLNIVVIPFTLGAGVVFAPITAMVTAIVFWRLTPADRKAPMFVLGMAVTAVLLLSFAVMVALIVIDNA